MGIDATSIPRIRDVDDTTIEINDDYQIAVKDQGITDDQLVSGLNGEGHIMVGLWESLTVVAGDWGLDVGTYGFTVANSTTPADNDEITYKVYLAKGTYTVGITAPKGTNRPILDIEIDGVSKGTIDLYFYISDPDYKDISISFDNSSSGIKTLGLKVNGKNGSSSAYLIEILSVTLFRTA